MLLLQGRDDTPYLKTWDQSFVTVLFKHYVFPLCIFPSTYLLSSFHRDGVASLHFEEIEHVANANDESRVVQILEAEILRVHAHSRELVPVQNLREREYLSRAGNVLDDLRRGRPPP